MKRSWTIAALQALAGEGDLPGLVSAAGETVATGRAQVTISLLAPVLATVRLPESGSDAMSAAVASLVAESEGFIE